MTALKSALFTVLVPGTAVVIVPFVLLSSRQAPLPAAPALLRILGAVLAAAGLALYFTCLAGFVRQGRGTPSPTDPPQRLVVAGPFRHTRNPMYLAVLSVVFGEAVFFGSIVLAAYAAALFLAFHLFVVLYEEPTLTRKFGDEYQAYRGSVRRWIGRRRAAPENGDHAGIHPR